MKKVQRILALAGVVLILLMYVMTMVFALRKDPAARGLFFGSLAMTVFVPIFLYAMQLAARMVRPGKSPVIDAVIFDLGRVLVDFPWHDHAESLGLSPEGLAFVENRIYESEYWHCLDRGTMTQEEVIRAFAEEAPELTDDIRRYIETIYHCLVPYSYTESWLAALQARGYRTYVLTNWPVGAAEEMRERGTLSFEKYVDGAVWSCEEHLLKPDPAIFQLLLSRYGLTASRCVFIDDREENVEAARAEGFAAFRFENYPDAVRRLASLGVKV
ncbi:MAG: HAD family phosphatase [Lachnospiraceae bacterium]|nr:HAD family phosphatase [Lachnospiraceae bacterium]